MKKIVISLSSIVVLALAVVGGTTALFTDTETSAGNLFTAGGLDLVVDATAHYNGATCENDEWVCDEWADHSVLLLVSQGLKKNGQPVDANRSNPDVALGLPQSSGADYDNPVVIGTFFSLGFGGQVVYRYDNFVKNGPGDDLKVYEITGGSSYPMEIARVEVSQDGTSWTHIGDANRDDSFDLGAIDWAKYVRITDITDPGIHTTTADGYDLDGIEALHCGLANEEILGTSCAGTWEETDLGPTHKFFDLDDLKPGDFGENTISLHVIDNDAYACATIYGLTNEENGLLDPEAADGDTTEDVGELAEAVNFFAWDDIDGDNRWEEGEAPFFSNIYGPAIDVLNGVTYPLGLLPATTTKYIGLEWCFGDMVVDFGNVVITCDGSSVNNIAQTDHLSANISFYIEQARNNEAFACPVVNVESLTKVD